MIWTINGRKIIDFEIVDNEATEYTDLEIQFWSVKWAAVTRLRKNFEQRFILSQAIQDDYSLLM